MNNPDQPQSEPTKVHIRGVNAEGKPVQDTIEVVGDEVQITKEQYAEACAKGEFILQELEPNTEQPSTADQIMQDPERKIRVLEEYIELQKEEIERLQTRIKELENE